QVINFFPITCSTFHKILGGITMVAVVKKNNPKTELSVEEQIDKLAAQGKNALKEMKKLSQEQIDKIIKEMALAGLEHHMYLAKFAVEETGRGIYEDKIIKHMFATEYVYHNVKYDKTVGVINENPHDGVVEIAEPIGVIAGVTPVTNPTSTTMFKSIISIKTGNPIIFAFNPSAQNTSSEAERILYLAAIIAGAHEHFIQWINQSSIEATQIISKHKDIATILATGGPGMVKSAYSSVKPALGVGAGNVPCYIETSVDIKRAVNDLILSKTFDNGMICASEQAMIVDKEIYDIVKQEMIDNNCYYLTPAEKKKVEKLVINEETGAVNPD